MSQGAPSAIPVTMTILVIWAIVFVLSLLGLGKVLGQFLVFDFRVPNIVTGLATSPLLIGIDPFSLLISAFMLYSFGGSLERDWGTQKYLAFLLLTNIAVILSWEICLRIFAGGFDAMSTSWLMMSSIIVAWAWLNAQQTLLFWFVLPMKAIWIGWLTIFIQFISLPLAYFRPNPLLPIQGIFALGGIGAAILFVKYQREWGWISKPSRSNAARSSRLPNSKPGGVSAFQEWQRRRRIAKLQRTIRFDDDRK